ncbi:hypothetical protein D3C72_1647020 [compost metagenome]
MRKTTSSDLIWLKKKPRSFTLLRKLNLVKKFYEKLSVRFIFRCLIHYGCSILRICSIYARVFTGAVLVREIHLSSIVLSLSISSRAFRAHFVMKLFVR